MTVTTADADTFVMEGDLAFEGRAHAINGACVASEIAEHFGTQPDHLGYQSVGNVRITVERVP